MTKRLVSDAYGTIVNVGRRVMPGWRPGVGLILLAMTAVAQAQYPVRQNGRLFDANPQVGSGGYNAGRPMAPLLLGNALAQGTIGRGMSFSSISPIGDPTAFHAGLGSALLSGFRRDSVSAADVSNPYQGLLGMPYYDSSQTVPTGGFLSGQTGTALSRLGPIVGGNTPMAGSGPLGPGPLDLRLDTRLNTGGAAPVDSTRTPGGLRSQIVGLSPGETSDLSSTIFGPAPRGTTSSAWAGDQAYRNLTRAPGLIRRDQEGQIAYEAQPLQEPPGARPLLGTPDELMRSSQLQSISSVDQPNPLGPVKDRRTQALGPQPNGPISPERRTGRPSSPGADATAAAPRLRDLSVLPGYDVFTDLQLGLALAANPNAGWFKEMQAAIRQNPTAAGMLDEMAKVEARDFVAKVVNTPLRSFHGRGDSPLNNELLKAESLLEIGQYYEAVHRYDAAHRLDPLNPLPLVGKGNALLAAGEYLSSVVALVQGFERYPELSRFSFDLAALMGGGEVVDIRRSDLMRRLQNEDEPRLRFLLGYLEYFGGDKESGMRNFEKAADLDAGASIISRFPAMLNGGRLPPPKVPSDAVPAIPEHEQPAVPSGAEPTK
jgi:hypothetical protein